MAIPERRTAAATACAHCGLPVPPALARADDDRNFCCHGCRAVFDAIHESGLERYYALRADDETAPAKVTGKSYAELDDEGFQSRACPRAPDGLASTELYLEGVHCAACVWLVEKVPKLVSGVAEVRLDLPRSRARVRWDPSSVRLSAIARTLDTLGYPVHPFRGAKAAELRRKEDRDLLIRIGLAGCVTGNVMAIAFAIYGGVLDGMEPEFARLFRWASLLITLPALVWGGGVFFRGAWSAVRTRTLHMDVPVAIGIAAGFLHGAVNTVRGAGPVYFDGVTALIFLLLAGRFIQRRQQRAAADAAELLAALAPSSARLLSGGEVREVPLEALVPGMRVEVRAGEVIPVDGTVDAGRSSLDVSLLSGESRPVDVLEGDRVHAGTVNLASRLEVAVESAGEDTRVGRLMRLVEEHARRRAPIVQLADRISGFFVAAVLALAALTFALWWRSDPAMAFDNAIALLIVTCPCALGLATPLAVSAAIGQAARAGILIRGADVVEKLAGSGRLWLDKTGTVTEGRVALLRWWGDEGAKTLVAAAEAHSSHPIARALVASVETPAAGPVEVSERQGGGIEGRVGRHRLVVGSPEFVASRAGGVPKSLSGPLEDATREGLTPIVVAVDGVPVAGAALGDPIRRDAAAAVARFRDLGWEVGILSGDHPAVAASVGARLGIDPAEARGGVGPEAKLETVLRSGARGTTVMVGDGVNDAAALAAAGVGVAVHGGAEAALTAADVFVTRPGVGPVVELIEGSRRTMAVIRRNLVFSLLYNAVGVALAMAGWIDPVVAAVMMPVSSLTVIVSSYRARTFAPRRRPPCP